MTSSASKQATTDDNGTGSFRHGVGFGSGSRVLISVAVAIHLCAVIAGPWAGPPPASLLAQRFAGLFEPYLRAAYLGHGYRYFAPNPEASHLVKYEVDLDDGSRVQGHFPDAQQHWPRLLYHRHFMISESLFTLLAPVAELPAEGTLNDEAMREFNYAKSQADSLVASIAQELLTRFDGQRVRLTLQEHLIPLPDDVRAGMRLTDKSLYVDLATIGEFTRDQL